MFLLFLLLVWSFADGEVRQLPWVVLTGSFIVQCHIGYAPLVVMAVALGGRRVLAGPPVSRCEGCDGALAQAR